MEIRIDEGSTEPAFAQIVSAVEDAAASARVAVGDRLPTVRGLADELGVAPGTVAKAYRELEARGSIETRGRKGSFVRARDEDRDALLGEAARAYLRAAGELGFDAAAARRALDEAAG